MDREGIVSQRPRRERCHVAVAATVTPRIFGLRHMPRGSEGRGQQTFEPWYCKAYLIRDTYRKVLP